MDPDLRLILQPVVALVFVTFAVWFYMYVLRIGHMRAKKIHPEQLKLAGREADELLKEVDGPSDNLVNLFEMPVLFYVAAFAMVALRMDDSLSLGLAWGFVGFRALHSLIHCTYNRVMHRFLAYAISSLLLLGLWARIATAI